MRLRQKHRCTPKGPSMVKANFFGPGVDGRPKELKGFQGYSGFEYHPTKGFRKSPGFVPGY